MRHGQSRVETKWAKQGDKFYIYKNYVNLFFCQMLNANES